MHVLACVFTVSAIASPHGSVGEFDPASETCTTYFERLEQFFVTNGIGNVLLMLLRLLFKKPARKRLL